MNTLCQECHEILHTYANNTFHKCAIIRSRMYNLPALSLEQELSILVDCQAIILRLDEEVRRATLALPETYSWKISEGIRDSEWVCIPVQYNSFWTSLIHEALKYGYKRHLQQPQAPLNQVAAARVHLQVSQVHRKAVVNTVAA